MGFLNLSQSQTSTIIGILIVALLLLDIHIRNRARKALKFKAFVAKLKQSAGISISVLSGYVCPIVQT